MGLRTPLESPDGGKNGMLDARSDCHAWGSHPLHHLHAGVLGLRPNEPFFRSVRIAPCPGGLRWIRAKTPTPAGIVESDLRFDGDSVRGTVSLPPGLSGVFVWKGRTLTLSEGSQTIDL